MNIQIIITGIGIILNIGVIYGVLKTNTKFMEIKLSELQKTMDKFGERLGTAEGDIKSSKAVCEERHKNN